MAPTYTAVVISAPTRTRGSFILKSLLDSAFYFPCSSSSHSSQLSCTTHWISSYSFSSWSPSASSLISSHPWTVEASSSGTASPGNRSAANSRLVLPFASWLQSSSWLRSYWASGLCIRSAGMSAVVRGLDGPGSKDSQLSFI